MHRSPCAKAMLHLMHAMADINAIARTAHKLLCDAEYSGSVIPHSLAAINMIAETAAEEAIAILEADIKKMPRGIMSMNNMQELKSTQSIRQYAALTASLLECAVLLTSSSDQKTERFVPDLLRVSFERADSLADALEEMEVTYVKN